MRNRSLLLWLLAGALGVGLLAWSHPRVYPFLPRPWTVSRDEAVAIVLERLRDLGDPVANPYVVVHLAQDPMVERRLQLAAERRGVEPLRRLGVGDQILCWEVVLYPRGGLKQEWLYRAEIALSGELLGLRQRYDPLARGKPIAPEEARRGADAFLARQGFDLSRYGTPEVRTQQLAKRTDTTLRYRDLRGTVAPGVFHGVEVLFAGDRLAGFQPYFDDPQTRILQRDFQGLQFTGILRTVLVLLLVGLLGFPFLKRYHEGEIGVRRSVQIFLGVLGVGLLLLALVVRGNSEDWGIGALTRQQITWMFMVVGLFFQLLPAAVLAFFAWSVGESVCRERWGAKLAAFDALFQGEWTNATVARASLRGWAAGLLVAGGLGGLLVLLRRFGIWSFASFAGLNDSAWPGAQSVAELLSLGLATQLALQLGILPLAVRRFGRLGGILGTAAVAAVVAQAPALLAPTAFSLGVSLLFALPPLVLFVAYDLLTALTASFVSVAAFTVYPMLVAQSTTVQLHGWVAVVLLAVPLVVSLRFLGSEREFVYRYDDVPPHVRRIAERERQRVELETARRIQSSILPELPPRISGLDIAHSYLPASEVGGDFYDVLALEDGRLAVAVGDVAGHGVSSGLVMSMAKSALAVQVTFDPEVAAVFQTLNRTVFQSARKRLLATLCYALIDPRRLEMLYASAGHLYPYRITAAGRVEALESTAYPLGVRGELAVEPRTARLAPGDTLFLFSDGVVEARREGSDDMFGFDRLEESLARHANRTVEGVRDGVLADVTRFTASAPREDDQTILVLRIP